MSLFDVETINPEHNPAYLEDVYFWVKRVGALSNLTMWHVDGEESPFIGYSSDRGMVFGAFLREIVGDDYPDTTCFKADDAEVVRDDALWAEYLRIGLCAIPGHFNESLDIDDRWATDGGKRTCQWCGRVEYLRRWEEVVKREAWEHAPDRTAGKCRAPNCYVAQVAARVSVDADKGLTVPLTEPWQEPDCSGCEVCGGTGVAP